MKISIVQAGFAAMGVHVPPDTTFDDILGTISGKTRVKMESIINRTATISSLIGTSKKEKEIPTLWLPEPKSTFYDPPAATYLASTDIVLALEGKPTASKGPSFSSMLSRYIWSTFASHGFYLPAMETNAISKLVMRKSCDRIDVAIDYVRGAFNMGPSQRLTIGETPRTSICDIFKGESDATGSSDPLNGTNSGMNATTYQPREPATTIIFDQPVAVVSASPAITALSIFSEPTCHAHLSKSKVDSRKHNMSQSITSASYRVEKVTELTTPDNATYCSWTSANSSTNISSLATTSVYTSIPPCCDLVVLGAGAPPLQTSFGTAAFSVLLMVILLAGFGFGIGVLGRLLGWCVKKIREPALALAAKEREIEELTTDKAKQAATIETQETQLAEQQKEVDEQKGQLEVTQGRLTTAQMESASCQTSLVEANEQITGLSKEKSEMQASIDDQSAQLAAKDEKFQEVSRENGGSKTKVQNQSKELENKNRQVERLNRAASDSVATLEQRDLTIKKVREQSVEKDTEICSLTTTCTGLSTELDTAKASAHEKQTQQSQVIEQQARTIEEQTQTIHGLGQTILSHGQTIRSQEQTIRDRDRQAERQRGVIEQQAQTNRTPAETISTQGIKIKQQENSIVQSSNEYASEKKLFETELATAKQERDGFQVQLTQQTTAAEGHKRNAEQAQHELAGVQQKLGNVRSELTAARDQCVTAEKQIEQSGQELDKSHERIGVLEREQETARLDLETQKAEVMRLGDELNALKSARVKCTCSAIPSLGTGGDDKPDDNRDDDDHSDSDSSGKGSMDSGFEEGTGTPHGSSEPASESSGSNSSTDAGKANPPADEAETDEGDDANTVSPGHVDDNEDAADDESAHGTGAGQGNDGGTGNRGNRGAEGGERGAGGAASAGGEGDGADDTDAKHANEDAANDNEGLNDAGAGNDRASSTGNQGTNGIEDGWTKAGQRGGENQRPKLKPDFLGEADSRDLDHGPPMSAPNEKSQPSDARSGGKQFQPHSTPTQTDAKSKKKPGPSKRTLDRERQRQARDERMAKGADITPPSPKPASTASTSPTGPQESSPSANGTSPLPKAENPLNGSIWATQDHAGGGTPASDQSIPPAAPTTPAQQPRGPPTASRGSSQPNGTPMNPQAPMWRPRTPQPTPWSPHRMPLVSRNGVTSFGGSSVTFRPSTQSNGPPADAPKGPKALNGNGGGAQLNRRPANPPVGPKMGMGNGGSARGGLLFPQDRRGYSAGPS